MGYETREFRVEDIEKIDPQPMQECEIPSLSACGPQAFEIMKSGGIANTVTKGGRPIGCGGVFRVWEGRGSSWALLDKSVSNADLVPIFRGARALINASHEALGVRRVDTYIDALFWQAIRWIELLGFEREATLRAFLPGGRDGHVYVKWGG